MRLPFLAGSVLLALTLGGCALRATTARLVPSETAAYVLLYRTGAGEAEDLLLAEAVAVSEGGSEIRLESSRGSGAGADGVVAWGGIPAGRYRGLALRLSRRGGAPVEERFEVPVSFSVASGQGRVVLFELSSEIGEDDEREEPRRPQVRTSLPSNRAPALLGVVPLRRAGALLLFDRVSGEISGVVPTGRGPAAATIDVLSGRAYVALAEEDAVEIVDLASPASIGRVPLAVGDRPVAIDRSADGRTIVTANRGSATLSIIDPGARLETARVSVGDRPVSVAVDPDGRTAYVAAEIPASVAVVDLGSASVVDRVSLEPGPVRLRLDFTGRRLVAAHREARVVLVIDAATRRVIRRIPLDSQATALALDPRSERIYVARRGALAVEGYDGGSVFPTRGFTVDGEVGFLEVDAEGNTLCIVLPDRGEVRLVGLVGGKVLARLGIGLEPGEPAFSGSR